MGGFSTFPTYMRFIGGWGGRARGPSPAGSAPSRAPAALAETAWPFALYPKMGRPAAPPSCGVGVLAGGVRRPLLPCRIPIPASRQYIRRGRSLGPSLSCVLFYTRRRNFFLPAWISAPCSCSGLRLYDFGASASPLIFTPPPSISRLASDTL